MKFRLLLSIFLTAASALTANAQNQTPDTSPIVVNGNLPYNITLSIHDMGSASVPGLQSTAYGQIGNEWVMLAGRTNGLHTFSGNGVVNFPPNFQNTDVVVINPVTQEVWSRTITGPGGGLTAPQVASLSATNTEFYQSGTRLYVAGGYVYDAGIDNFTTYDTLSALDLPGVINWVKNGTGTFADNFRQVHDPVVQVTGGDMFNINGRTLMVLGQDFEGPYTPGASGVYTQQVRAFDVIDNGTTLSIANVTASAPDPNLRRRDLNVVPMYQSDGQGGTAPGLIALSGVFTPAVGAWTVPVEITANGTPSMADPNDPGTFKQGMNGYHTAHLSLYDTTGNTTHTILLGGISLQYYDSGNATFITDNDLPFIDQATSIVRDFNGNYTQYLLEDATYPFLHGPHGPLLFGAEASFFLAPGVPLLGNGMIDLDSLTDNMLLGYVYGGIVAEQGNFGATTASGYIFEVHYSAVPEPADAAWLLGAGAVGVLIFKRRFARQRSTT